MTQVKVDNINVEAYEVLTTPEGLKHDLPLSDQANEMLAESRQVIRDILDKKLADLRQEAPFAYKGIGPVVDTISSSGMARPVAELTPIMTVKG